MQADDPGPPAPKHSTAPGHLTDYYGLLQIEPGFSDLRLLKRFLQGCKKAMASGDHNALASLLRRGFEVLRYEDTRVSYFRMHRVLVRREPLRFPEVKKNEMLQDIRAKEELAAGGTGPVMKPGMTYDQLLSNVMTDVALRDLSHVFYWGASGLVLLLGSAIIIAVNGMSWLTFGTCPLLWGFAMLAIRSRLRDYVGNA